MWDNKTRPFEFHLLSPFNFHLAPGCSIGHKLSLLHVCVWDVGLNKKLKYTSKHFLLSGQKFTNTPHYTYAQRMSIKLLNI